MRVLCSNEYPVQIIYFSRVWESSKSAEISVLVMKESPQLTEVYSFKFIKKCSVISSLCPIFKKCWSESNSYNNFGLIPLAFSLSTTHLRFSSASSDYGYGYRSWHTHCFSEIEWENVNCVIDRILPKQFNDAFKTVACQNPLEAEEDRWELGWWTKKD